MSFWETLLVFLGVLSLLVFAHELGHFVTAKRAGIKVEEFGFGYPPRLFGVRRGETLYSINLLPLGGFVKMLGETAVPGEPRAFASKSKVVRAVVLIAGSAMNLLLAPVLYSAAFMVGEPVPCDSCGQVQIYHVQPSSPAEEAGIRQGDVFVTIGGQTIREGSDVSLAVRNAGQRPLDVVVRRDGRDLTLNLTPRSLREDGQPMLGVQIGPEFVTVQRPIWEAVPLGIERTGETVVLFMKGLKQMVVREVPADLAGPVGIAQMTGRAAEAGLAYLLQFTAFLSLNLAIFNMLPVPGLDGARLAFVMLEGARGRRVNPKTEGVIHFVGMIMLITLMIYVSFNDVRKLIPS